MIFHTIHTITIDRFGMGFKYPENIKRLPIPMPKKWMQRAFGKLVLEYNELTNKDTKKVDDLLDDKYHATSLNIRIEMLKTMFKGLELSWVIGADTEMLELYKDYFKKDFDTDGLQMLSNEIKKLSSKLNSVMNRINPPKTSEPVKPKDTDFDLVVLAVESWLNPQKIGSEKLYKMPYFIDKAALVQKQREKTA